MTTQGSVQKFPNPHECWKEPDENSEKFPKYDDGFPEDLILNDAERKILENLPEGKMEEIIYKRRRKRNLTYIRYLEQKK